MSTRSKILAAVVRNASIARVETRRSAPQLVRTVGAVAGWSLVAVFLGALVGISAVVLPPMGAFTIVAVAAVIFLWVMPGLPTISIPAIRRLFYIMFTVSLCVPTYYAIALPGMPWISIRRIAAAPLIIALSLALATSQPLRSRVKAILIDGKLKSICAIGFLAMIVISVFFSANPFESLSQTNEIITSWYIPFLALLCIVDTERDIIQLMKVVAWCALVVSLIGVAEFVLHRRVALEVLPAPVIASLMENNPSFAGLVNSSPMRNGMWRASSIFTVSLSFGEFESIVAPIGYFFLVHGRSFKAKAFGLAVGTMAIVGIFCSGSRGAYASVIAATVAFTFLWLIRAIRFERGSLAPALVGLVSFICFAILFGLILFWPRMHNVVMGGGIESYSDQARWEEVAASIPHILDNPITGHGISMGGTVVGYRSPGSDIPSLDSYVLSLLVETGVPGFFFFFGMIIFSALSCARIYISNRTILGPVAGCIGCAVVAYGTYRVFLSQRESHTLFFALVACAIWLSHAYARATAPKRQPHPFEIRPSFASWAK